KRILRLPLDAPRLAEATVVVPESDAVIRSFVPADRYLYVVEMLGGPTQLRVYDTEGGSSRVVATEEPVTLSGLVRINGDEVMVQRQSYMTPP
ncbi:MAG: S9 family peptidase, partial [Acidobacteria bacterium]|nr:S9 family peptidase [Acidobacteriota bacterium]NIQ85131.1 S9 family peptidase [Acidobacteriota bacterium]